MAEVGPALALDAGDKGRIERVPLAAVPALPEAAQLPLLSRGLFHSRAGWVFPVGGVNSFGRGAPEGELGGHSGYYRGGKAQHMKTTRTHTLSAAALCLMILGCSRSGGPAPGQAVAPAPAMAAPTPTVALPAPIIIAPTAAPAAETIPSTWADMEKLTFDQRASFVAALSGLVGKLDAQIGALNAKRAAMTTDTKDWDIAMMGVTAARAYLVGLSDEVSRASPDTWDQEKERVGTAWQNAEDACDKVSKSTTS